MLNALRRGAKTIYAKALIAVLVAAFSLWGISGFVNQIDPTEVARAGDTPVSAAEFQRVYERTMANTARQFGQQLTPQQAQAIGLPSQVLSQLVTEALQVDAAHELGVDIGDEKLAERIRQDPSFVGSSGRFDRLMFEQILAGNRYTEAEFIELQRDAVAQEMLVNGLFGGFEAPLTYLRAYNRYRNQTRRVAFFVLGQDAIGAIETPDEATLRAYYDEHKEDFRAPEYRAISTVTLSVEAIADPGAVSADAVRRAYEVEGAYAAPERRRVQQIVLDDEDVARQAAEAINDGTTFSAILDQLDRTMAEADLGVVQRSDLDPAVAEAAFGLEVNKAAAVEGPFGPVLVRVSEIEPVGKVPLGEVEAQIREQIALEDARDQLRTLHDNIEDAVAGGARVDEIAGRFSLPSRRVNAVDEEGVTPQDTTLEPPLAPEVLASAFAASEGDDPEPVELDDSYTWVQLDGITPAAERPFDTVSGAVLLAWTASEKAERLASVAEEATAAVNDGTSPEEVAASYGVEATVTEPFSQGEPSAALPQAANVAAFEGPVGYTTSVADDQGRRIVLKVTEISEPAFFEQDPDLQNARQVIDEGMVDTMLYEFVTARQADVGATVNQPVLDQIIGVGEVR